MTNSETKYACLIIGGGMTADAAARSFRANAPDASIGLIGAEADPPYDRPPLTKDLWNETPLDEVWRSGARDAGVDMMLDRTVLSIAPEQKRVMDDQGRIHTFDKLLLATGTRPKTLDFDVGNIRYFRTLQDYRIVADWAKHQTSAVVIGGGFIGSELAAALAMNDIETTLVFPEPGINARMFPPSLANKITEYYRKRGVNVVPNVMAYAVEERNGMKKIYLNNETTVTGAFVVAGIGVAPNVELAVDAGLKVDDGILVDDHCRTSHPDIFAAGDVAQFHSPLLDANIRVEHEDNANEMGAAAGRCMAGVDKPYNHLPYFYSDLFDLGYEAIGQTRSDLETIEFWQDEECEKGTVFYLDDGRLKGAVFWNVWDRLDPFRKLLAEAPRQNYKSLETWENSQ